MTPITTIVHFEVPSNNVAPLTPLGVPEPAIPVLGTLETRDRGDARAPRRALLVAARRCRGHRLHHLLRQRGRHAPPRTRLRHCPRSSAPARLGRRPGTDTRVFLT